LPDLLHFLQSLTLQGPFGFFASETANMTASTTKTDRNTIDSFIFSVFYDYFNFKNKNSAMLFLLVLY